MEKMFFVVYGKMCPGQYLLEIMPTAYFVSLKKCLLRKKKSNIARPRTHLWPDASCIHKKRATKMVLKMNAFFKMAARIRKF